MNITVSKIIYCVRFHMVLKNTLIDICLNMKRKLFKCSHKAGFSTFY